MTLRILFAAALACTLAACATNGGYAYGPPVGNPRQDVRCYDCGTVDRIVTVYGDSSTRGGGALLGGIVGGVLGNQVGKGDGRTAATVAGAVGGAVLGNQIEKNAKSAPTYDVYIHMDNGDKIVINQRDASRIGVGSYVRVSNNRVLPLR